MRVLLKPKMGYRISVRVSTPAHFSWRYLLCGLGSGVLNLENRVRIPVALLTGKVGSSPTRVGTRPRGGRFDSGEPWLAVPDFVLVDMAGVPSAELPDGLGSIPSGHSGLLSGPIFASPAGCRLDPPKVERPGSTPGRG